LAPPGALWGRPEARHVSFSASGIMSRACTPWLASIGIAMSVSRCRQGRQ
jgi:hypothetical protein